MKLLVLAALFLAASAVRFDGYQTLRIHPRDKDQLQFIHNLGQELDGELDFWSDPRSTQRPTDIMVPPSLRDEITSLLANKGIQYEVMIDDVQALIDDQERSRNVQTTAEFDYGRYHVYAEIQQWVYDISDQYSSIATPFQIATSVEGRAINAIKISTGGGGSKKAVYWQGGIHAREWISPATVMFIAKSLLENYGSDPLVTDIFDTFDFYIVPSLNADGYHFTWTNNRMWRKNRAVNEDKLCPGVDLNRNYAYGWGGEGSGSAACNYVYRGPSPASEPEVSQTTQFLLDTNQYFVSFIDFHSYSQLWLAPWSYSSTEPLPVDADDQDAAAAKACNALYQVYGTEYVYGPSARTLYVASGVSEDWGYVTLGAKYSYVVELRDTGAYGFILPEDQIIPSGEETYAAVKAFCQHLLDEFK